MAHLRTIELAEILKDLPDAATFNPSTHVPLAREDLFICALGFEERCVTIPTMLARQGYTSRRAVFLEYSTNRIDNSVNLPRLEEALRSISSQVTAIQIDDLNSVAQLSQILDQIGAEPLSVRFDISVSSNKAMFRVLRALIAADVSLHVLYAEAATYHPTRSEYQTAPERWANEEGFGLEHGVSEVAASTEYPGRHLDPLPNCVLVFPSFKPDRAKAAINLVDPALLAKADDSVKWLLGVPHLAEDEWRLQIMRTINGIAPASPQYEVSTFDYKETLGTLEQLYRAAQDRFNISLAPFGSKMQALASCLFCHICPDVRVIFASPKEYDASLYSKGTKATWHLDFGFTRDLRTQLARIGQIQLEG
jgi:hypothetical protein